MSAPTVPLDFHRLPLDDMRARADDLAQRLATRRSVRHFAPEPIPVDVVTTCIAAAATAPSGAHKQPWTFVLVTDPTRKRAIREAAEREETAFYAERASAGWKRDLEPLGTGPDKPYLEHAPALVVVFAQSAGPASERHYYVTESVGIAVGMLIASLHLVGLATLAHTPAPMRFLRELCGRPRTERAFCVIPVGYPADDCRVPAIGRKPLEEVLVRI